jgi:hypothetical protein
MPALELAEKSENSQSAASPTLPNRTMRILEGMKSSKSILQCCYLHTNAVSTSFSMSL